MQINPATKNAHLADTGRRLPQLTTRSSASQGAQQSVSLSDVLQSLHRQATISSPISSSPSTSHVPSNELAEEEVHQTKRTFFQRLKGRLRRYQITVQTALTLVLVATWAAMLFSDMDKLTKKFQPFSSDLRNDYCGLQPEVNQAGCRAWYSSSLSNEESQLYAINNWMQEGNAIIAAKQTGYYFLAFLAQIVNLLVRAIYYKMNSQQYLTELRQSRQQYLRGMRQDSRVKENRWDRFKEFMTIFFRSGSHYVCNFIPEIIAWIPIYYMIQLNMGCFQSFTTGTSTIVDKLKKAAAITPGEFIKISEVRFKVPADALQLAIQNKNYYPDYSIPQFVNKGEPVCYMRPLMAGWAFFSQQPFFVSMSILSIALIILNKVIQNRSMLLPETAQRMRQYMAEHEQLIPKKRLPSIFGNRGSGAANPLVSFIINNQQQRISDDSTMSITPV